MILLAVGCGGANRDSSSSEIILPTACAEGQTILTQQQIELVQSQFSSFQAELYCDGAVASDPTTLTPDNYVPARWFGQTRPFMSQQTPLGVHYESNGFDFADIAFSLPTQIDYFDVDGQPFSVGLPGDEGNRQVRVTATEIDRIFLAVQDTLARQFPEVREVSPSSITVNFQATIFFVTNSNFGDTWAGGATLPDGRTIHVAFFELSPHRKIPISWRGIPGVSAGWLENEFRNALCIQSGHPECAQ